MNSVRTSVPFIRTVTAVNIKDNNDPADIGSGSFGHNLPASSMSSIPFTPTVSTSYVKSLEAKEEVRKLLSDTPDLAVIYSMNADFEAATFFIRTIEQGRQAGARKAAFLGITTTFAGSDV